MPLPVLVVTTLYTLLHALPPPPSDPERSRVNVSHLPIVDGAVAITVGFTGADAERTVVELAVTYGQVWPMTELQSAFIFPPSMVKLPPKSIVAAPPIVTCKLDGVLQVQVDEAERANINSVEQGKKIAVDIALSVGALKRTLMNRPLSENDTEETVGVGGTAPLGSTMKLLCPEYTTAYSLADGPDKVTARDVTPTMEVDADVMEYLKDVVLTVLVTTVYAGTSWCVELLATVPTVTVVELVGLESKDTCTALNELEPRYNDWIDRLTYTFLQHSV